MKQKPLQQSDLEMWMNESFQMYACNTGVDRKSLKLAINHFGVARVTLGAEILYEGKNVTAAIAIYNENI
jgi:hypothetical protein